MLQCMCAPFRGGYGGCIAPIHSRRFLLPCIGYAYIFLHFYRIGNS